MANRLQVISAHNAVEEIREWIGSISRLRKPLAHVHRALDLTTELKEYDDKHPVHWYEVFPTENTPSQLSPNDLWLHFKLESLRPCLCLLVRLFGFVLPDCKHMWDECESSLVRKQWIRQFILDFLNPPKVPPKVPAAFLHLLRTRQPIKSNLGFWQE
ncbi:uncharacterized protein F4822DRAFT_132959 [Hypoxylon trugodes]|uniref:uncharacterized protein n=1 Tax=Hypoxylon trugodes TaxID=326681 RepID=UPI00219B0062|nr:uncharacterized protein F4822DRAFT_132959 [Hypoxylon trugodes]KAI1392576.1 hypothetical protein F4822DRAFT_132959 [Hypoxylon trugodes]